MDKLYIIGNGFDLHHGLPTSYKGFCNYLKLHNPTVLDNLNKSFSYPSSDDDIWCRFEENLSFIDLQFLDDIICEYIPNLSSDDYFRDMAACHRESEIIIFSLTEGLRNEFSNYIQLASKYNVDSSRLLDIDRDAFYISFNYTKTLEYYYRINSDKILYIHGTFDDREDIVLGHAVDPDNFIQEKEHESPPAGLTPEENEQWNDYMSDQHIPFLDEAREELASYYGRSYKNPEKIIEYNSEFFAGLNVINSVFVLGHSMSDVDIRYFEAIKEHVQIDCHWTVSFYSEAEKKYLEGVLLGLGIPATSFNLVKLTKLAHSGICK
ncbi:bacteriophage abortive infection AbiH family protein [Pseudoalteromonas sp. Ps84H-4]|uniref:bacteriophage abortive infection AbiH family protein n=1 Tax=Pseudoalteromonas sp. Ps84H-4 TaxID=2954502 RepID=UPI002097FE0A|nr:bacteriophage abortive infection AbiH family protein [Pseudoalteromonas sp. Ps84H-4]MCO7248828.1 bacteriophage abortive infection AbiH family protein [Pseudoalteromonas sp. Ps84H-4]